MSCLIILSLKCDILLIVTYFESRGRLLAIKAVFFDIDGTFLTDMKKVQKSTEQAIRELKRQGILVGLATGRGPAFATPFMENYGFDFAVTYNGQYIFTRDRVIYERPLPKKALLKVMAYTKKHRIEVSLGTKSGLFGSGFINMGTNSRAQFLSHLLPKKVGKLIEQAFKHGVRRFRPQNYEKLKLLLNEPIYQLVLVAATSQTALLEQAFPQLTVTRSSPYSADIISKDQSKLRGICHLAEAFDFDLYEVMAFGDSDNDADMLANVGVGIAMGNASPKLAAVAHYQTADNNSDGIAKALFHHGLIHLERRQHFKSKDDNFNKVKDFHRLVDGSTDETPRVYSPKEAGNRAAFKLEELVEFLAASCQGDSLALTQEIINLHTALDRAAEKVKTKPVSDSPLVGQVDALTDLLYFTYGSFVLMGVDPKPLFDTVHESNMAKIFPDGRAHVDPETKKVLKPDNWEAQHAPEPALKRELERQVRKALKHQQSSEA